MNFPKLLKMTIWRTQCSTTFLCTQYIKNTFSDSVQLHKSISFENISFKLSTFDGQQSMHEAWWTLASKECDEM